MPEIELITFDAAQTIVQVDWNPRLFALGCAQAVGLSLDDGLAGDVYERLLGTRWLEYQRINTTRDVALCEGFWRELSHDWLAKVGAPLDKLDAMLEQAEKCMYVTDSPIFQPYEDTIPALTALREAGYRLAVISNWDFSLHRVLRVHQLSGLFELVLASFEEGIEKPAPEIFHIALSRLNVHPSRALHVGDDPYDDVHGAHRAGMRALLFDRAQKQPAPGVIATLHDIAKAIQE